MRPPLRGGRAGVPSLLPLFLFAGVLLRLVGLCLTDRWCVVDFDFVGDPRMDPGEDSSSFVARMLDFSLGGVVNALAGGRDNCELHRTFARELEEVAPGAGAAARAALAFRQDAAQEMARVHGLSQVLDLGCGLRAPWVSGAGARSGGGLWPGRNPLDVAAIVRAVHPGGRVAFVDDDLHAMVAARALRAEGDGVAVRVVDPLDLGAVFADRGVCRVLDLSEPLGVLAVSLPWRFRVQADAAWWVGRLAGMLAPGSVLAVSQPVSSMSDIRREATGVLRDQAPGLVDGSGSIRGGCRGGHGDHVTGLQCGGERGCVELARAVPPAALRRLV